MSDTKHTPPPWKTLISGRVIEIQPKSAGKPIVGWTGFDESDVPLATHKANARFIVRAVNSHYALLAVSERARDMIGLIYSVGVGNEDEAKIMSDLITALNAAIAAAKGTTP